MVKTLKDTEFYKHHPAANMKTPQGPYIPIKLGFVNCYLIKTATGYILIDTGYPKKRNDLENALQNAGCKPGTLQLIIITHQDFDHTGNCAYLRDKYATKIAIHREDSGAVVRGDMLWNRNGRNILTRLLFPIILVAFRTGQFKKFNPNLYLAEGDGLLAYGFDATVLHLPGHSKGSIGILTAGRDLFCGDLLMNFKKPDKSSLIDDSAELETSIAKLRRLEINMVYPGHGKPFPMKQFLKNYQ